MEPCGTYSRAPYFIYRICCEVLLMYRIVFILTSRKCLCFV